MVPKFCCVTKLILTSALIFPLPTQASSRTTVSLSCSSKIPESERVDCAGDVTSANEGICRSRSCKWCSTNTPNIPYCFHDISSSTAHIDFLQRQCQTCSYCPYAKDCHPEPGATAKRCAARGCLWCSSSCGPNCVYSKAANLDLIRMNCTDCSSCVSQRVDCHPEPGADYGKCLTRGCLWCQTSGNPGTPPCMFGHVTNLVTDARKKCPTCGNCQARVDCHPEPGATNQACTNRNCIWCPTTEPGQPYCVYGGSSLVTQNTCKNCSDCNTKVQCLHAVPNPNQLQCETYGCLWCPLKSFGTHMCVQYLL